MQKTFFANIPVGGRFHLSRSSGLLADVGVVDPTRVYIKRSARTYYDANDLPTTLHVGSVHAKCWEV